MVVMATVTYGTIVVLVVTWLVVLVAGRLPSSLHQLFSAVIRYQARLNGYLTLVTSQYPWGLLGDPESAAAVVGSPAWQPAPPSPVHDPYWQVVLSARAKNLIVFVLVLGVASVAGVNISTAVSRYHRLQTDEMASARVQGAYQSLTGAVIRYESRSRSCPSSVQPLPCLTGAARSVSQAFNVFVQSLSTTTMPSVATSARGVVVADGAHAERDFEQLSASTTAGRYELVIESSDLSGLLIRFDRDYQQLGTQLTDAG